MRRTILLVPLLVVVTTLTACGGNNDHSSGGMNMSGSGGMHGSSRDEESRPVVPGAREVAVQAEDLSFRPKRIPLQAGEDVTIVLTSGDIEHDFVVQGVAHVVHAQAGDTEEGGLRIDEPGTYRFWCTIPGHRAGGMLGTITVT